MLTSSLPKDVLISHINSYMFNLTRFNSKKITQLDGNVNLQKDSRKINAGNTLLKLWCSYYMSWHIM